MKGEKLEFWNLNCESPCFSFELVKKWAVNIGNQCFSFDQVRSHFWDQGFSIASEKWQARIGNHYFSFLSEISELGINVLIWKVRNEKSELWIFMFLIWTSEKVGSQHWGSMFFLWLSENSQLGINIYHLIKWKVRNQI